MTRYEVDPGGKFQKTLERLGDQLSDFTIPFTLITKSWFKGNLAIFALKGPGKYVDLSKNYKERKQKAHGSAYPILLGITTRKHRRGQIMNSLTQPGDSGAIAEIINKKELVLGTRVPYARHVHFGTKVMPARPMLFIGAEQTAPESLNKRQEAWIKIFEDYADQVLSKEA